MPYIYDHCMTQSCHTVMQLSVTLVFYRPSNIAWMSSQLPLVNKYSRAHMVDMYIYFKRI